MHSLIQVSSRLIHTCMSHRYSILRYSTVLYIIFIYMLHLCIMQYTCILFQKCNLIIIAREVDFMPYFFFFAFLFLSLKSCEIDSCDIVTQWDRPFMYELTENVDRILETWQRIYSVQINLQFHNLIWIRTILYVIHVNVSCKYMIEQCISMNAFNVYCIACP